MTTNSVALFDELEAANPRLLFKDARRVLLPAAAPAAEQRVVVYLRTGTMNNHGRDVVSALATAKIVSGEGNVTIYAAGSRKAKEQLIGALHDVKELNRGDQTRATIVCLDKNKRLSVLAPDPAAEVCSVSVYAANAENLRGSGSSALTILVDAEFMDKAILRSIAVGNAKSPIVVLHGLADDSEQLAELKAFIEA